MTGVPMALSTSPESAMGTPVVGAKEGVPSDEEPDDDLDSLIEKADYFGLPRGIYAKATQALPRCTPEEEMAAALRATPPSSPYPHIGGDRLGFPLFVDFWYEFAEECKSFGIDASVSLAMSRFGFIPELIRNPLMLRPPPEAKLSEEGKMGLDQLVSELLDLRHVESIPPPTFQGAWDPVMQFRGGLAFPVPRTTRPFAQTLFLVPKPGKVGRAVLNSKPYNIHVVPRSFKMEGIHTLRQLLQKNDYMLCCDLSAGYHTVGIHPEFRDHFCFRHRDKWYRYRGVPFGVKSMPRAFTKLLRPLVAYVRVKYGMRIIVYLDDFLILHQDPVTLVSHMEIFMNLLVSAGFLINVDKSELTPTRSLVWLGWMVDSRDLRLLLPYRRRRRLQRNARQLLRRHAAGADISLRDLMILKGCCQAAGAGVYVAQLRTRAIQRVIRANLRWAMHLKRVEYDAVLPPLPTEVLQEALWWATELPFWNGKPLHRPPSSLVTDTDAAGSIGGAMVFALGDPEEGTESRWLWHGREMFRSVNWKELQAFPMGAKALSALLPDKFRGVFWTNRTDNTSSMAHVNRQGGRFDHLSLVAEEFWEWLLLQGSHCLAVFVAGIENVRADAGSRALGGRKEWQLSPEVFEMIQVAFGPHDTDLFAARTNALLPRYYSYHADPDAAGRDALNQDWTKDGNLFCHPPFAMIPLVLRRIRETGVSITLVAPLWPAQPWISALMALSCAPPLLLPQQNLLRPTIAAQQDGKGQPAWRTAAWRLCGKASLPKVFSLTQWQAFFDNGE